MFRQTPREVRVRMATGWLPPFVSLIPFHNQYLTFHYNSSSESEKDEDVVAPHTPVASPAEADDNDDEDYL
jgi:hypothetical protein